MSDDGSEGGGEGEPDDEEENENQAISRADLLKLIEEMPTMRGDLNAPMTNGMYTQLENMLSSEDTKCKDLAETHLRLARTEDMSDSIDFCDEPIIVNFSETLQFFKKYELFEGASKLADVFHEFVKQQSERIKQARDFRNLSEVGQLIMEST